MAGGLQHKIFLGYAWWFIEVDEERTQHFNVSPGFWFHVSCLPFLKLGNGVGKEFIRKLLRCVEPSQKGTIVWDKACGEHGNTPDALKEHNKYLSPKGVMQLIEKSHRTKSFLRDLGNICTREDLSTVFQTWIASDFTGLPIARPVVPVALRPVPLLPPSPVVVPLQPPPPVALLPVPPLPPPPVAPQMLPALPVAQPLWWQPPPVVRELLPPLPVRQPLAPLPPSPVPMFGRKSTPSAKAIELAAQLLQEADPDGVPLLDAIANVLESRTPGVLGKRTLEAAMLCVVNSKPRLAKVYCAVASAGASTLWELMYARDMGITSLDSYHLLRGASIMKVGLPPARWLSDYATIVNEQAAQAWMFYPSEGDMHESVCANGEARGANHMDNTKILGLDLKEVLRWHIYECIARGEDISPYVKEEGRVAECMKFKITFDTTQTASDDLFMLGIIPHTFANKSGIQSSLNVMVLCLAKLAETTNMISNACPELEAHIKDIMTNGLSLGMVGMEDVVLQLDIHIAADLKALWLALGLPNFVCTECCAASREDMVRVQVDHAPRAAVEEIALGVPSQNVHLCALHAVLRIVERLLKNAATHAVSQKDKNKRINALKIYLTKALKRKKFVITTNVREVVGEPDLMEEDLILFQGNGALGRNVSQIVKRNIFIKLSALTGPQARAILTQGYYKTIVDITEKACTCAARQRMIAETGTAGSATCRKCKVLGVWEMFANVINPLISAKGIPERLKPHVKNADRLEQEFLQIEADGQRWLEQYTEVFDAGVTPYVHIIGKHVASMLKKGGFSIGEWSQQGFEACHKLIRRIFHGATNQGGGGAATSSLVQIMNHLFRRQWARIQSALKDNPEHPDSGYLSHVRANFENMFFEIECDYSKKHPKRCMESYVQQQSLKMIQRNPEIQPAAHKKLLVLLDRN